MSRQPGADYVYVAAIQFRKVYYIGFTNDLERRIREHKTGVGSRFTSQYRISDLLYWEEYREVRDAIARENHLKAWSRAKKLKLICKTNPEHRDCSGQWTMAGT